MTDFGELVDVNLLIEKHDSSCYFCNYKEELEPRSNDSDDDFNEDAFVGAIPDGKGIKHKNDSGKLGRNCQASDPGELWVEGDDFYVPLPVWFAAHHLIPGNASLKKSKLFNDADCGIKVKGKAKGNVGYDVNNPVNGVWLPGNYAFSSIKLDPKKKGSAWGEIEELVAVSPQTYAFGAIEFSGCQFHDAHEDYSAKIVLKALDAIYNKLKKVENTPWCPEAANRDKKKAPLYDIVNRLASLSLRLRAMLTFPAKAWKLNVFTSKFSNEWMAAQKTSRRKWNVPRRAKG